MALVARAESLVGSDDLYFGAVGMLPNPMEPSTLWLDRMYVLQTPREQNRSEAYRILAESPPKLIIWSYRLDAVEPAIAPLVRDSYVQVAPNIRVAGRRLRQGMAVTFDVPIAGSCGLYNSDGAPVRWIVQIDGRSPEAPVRMSTGPRTVTLRAGPDVAFSCPKAPIAGASNRAATSKTCLPAYTIRNIRRLAACRGQVKVHGERLPGDSDGVD